MKLPTEVPIWDGQEIFIWEAMLVYAEHISYKENKVSLVEFPNHPYQDRFIISLDDFYKLQSAPPEMIP